MAQILDRVLDLRSLITDLVADRKLEQTDANMLLGSSRTREQAMMHPLSYIASQNFGNHFLSKTSINLR